MDAEKKRKFLQFMDDQLKVIENDFSGEIWEVRIEFDYGNDKYEWNGTQFVVIK